MRGLSDHQPPNKSGHNQTEFTTFLSLSLFRAHHIFSLGILALLLNASLSIIEM